MSQLRKRNVAFAKEASGDEHSEWEEEGNEEKGSIVRDDTLPSLRDNLKTAAIDRMLQAYAKFTSSASNQDKIMKVVQYSLWMISRFYKNSGRHGLVQLSGQISWARYINRFLGLPAALEAVRSGSYGNPKALGKAMAWAMVFYYPLEHISYLKWQAPKLMTRYSSKRLAERASALSCQCWLAYILLDIVRSALALKESDAPESRRSERLQIIRNALFAFPAVHWSLPNWDTDPLMSDGWVNFLMWLESMVCMYQGIANFQ
mmetsp:Transcript_84888/g.127264  ORF Transcript_84888/g.127264 Transcript_84888/m.127264 type:complete len:261 (-) Transcript_84888:321-1103(-)